MGMKDQSLSPGVQDGKESDRGSQVLGVGGNGAERLGGRAEEDPVDH